MKKKILYIILFFVVSIGALFFTLKNGIVISSIQFDFLKLEQLYIKLDKKLIVRAKNITINDENNSTVQDQMQSNASTEILKITKNLKYLYAFVEEIDIQNLNLKDNHVRILLKNNEFFIDNELIFLKLILQRQDDELIADVKRLLLKDYDLDIDGNLSINTKSEFYHFQGKANGELLDFNISISYKNKNLAYKLQDLNLKNASEFLKRVNQRVELPEALNIWLMYKIKGEFCYFDYLQGFVDFNKDDYFDNISALGYVNNVKIHLDDKINPIEIPKLDLNLSKQKLDFTFKKASYNNADLSSSKVYLYDLFDEKKAGIYLRIKSDNLRFDDKLAKALEEYDFSLPFYQTSGNLKSDLELKIDFYNEKISYNGILALENANISLNNFNIIKAFVKINQDKLNIENASVKNEFLEADFNASLDLQKQQGIFDTQISRLYFDNGEFLDVKNQQIKINLDYAKDVKMNIPQWNLSLNFKEGLEIVLNNSKILFSYSPFLQKFGFIEAKQIYFKTINFEDFNARIDDAYFQNNLLINGETPYENDSFDIIKNQGIIEVYTQSGTASAKISSSNKEIHLKNLSYIYKKDFNSSNDSIFDIASNTQNIDFGGANVALILSESNKTLAFDKLEAKLQGDSLNLKGSRRNTNIDLYYSSSDLKLDVKDMDDYYVNEFFQKKTVQDGVFNLSIKGSGLEYFEGQIDFKNTYVKDLRGINQLISFIDTVPSLLMFKSPTFNQKGLSLHDGKILFNRKKDLLSISAINLNGDSVDIYGLGSANLRLNTIDLNLELKTLKSASEAISKVPILNYVILGKNQEISTNIKVNGSIDEPKFHTQIFTDTLKTPFNLIKNIIQLPVNLFN